MPFTNNSRYSLFEKTYTTEQQAYSNLRNLLLTRLGERYLHPDFGTNILDSLFEANIDLVRTNIRESITTSVAKWLPYISIQELKISVPDSFSELAGSIGNKNLEHVIWIQIFYSVLETGAQNSITLGVGPNGNIGVI